MPVYEKLVKLFRYCANADCTECAVAGCHGPQAYLAEAADAIEERDKAVLTIQHEMMAEAESHIALVERIRNLRECGDGDCRGCSLIILRYAGCQNRLMLAAADTIEHLLERERRRKQT